MKWERFLTATGVFLAYHGYIFSSQSNPRNTYNSATMFHVTDVCLFHRISFLVLDYRVNLHSRKTGNLPTLRDGASSLARPLPGPWPIQREQTSITTSDAHRKAVQRQSRCCTGRLLRVNNNLSSVNKYLFNLRPDHCSQFYRDNHLKRFFS